jgi:hypothetical protein
MTFALRYDSEVSYPHVEIRKEVVAHFPKRCEGKKYDAAEPVAGSIVTIE